MGILTDFVIANDCDGSAIGEAIRPADRWPTLEAKGVDTIKLSTLYCSISGVEYSSDLERSFELVGGNQDEGPWVFKFPEVVLDAIASVPTANFHAVAEAWASTEELQMDRWTSHDAAEFITLIQKYAQKARSTNATMFLWMSL